MYTPGTEPFDSDQTSGTNPTAWTLTAPSPQFEPLTTPCETEVLVIGGGIAGVSIAYALALSGKQVVLVEDGFLGSGETGRTTAHLTYSLGERYADLEKHFGTTETRRIAESHRAAIAFIQDAVEREQITCHFQTVDGYLFLHPNDNEETLPDEVKAMQQIGFPVTLETAVPHLLNGDRQPCIRFPEQAQFHPLLYLNGLAEAILRMGGKIYTQSKADDITPEGAVVNGFPVKARHIVVATNTTVNNNKTLRLQVKQWPYRSYAIAVRIPKGSIQPALWWDTGDPDSIWMAKPYHYVRTEPGPDGHDLLIVGGEDHRTGQEHKEEITQKDRYQRLFDWAKTHFTGVTDIAAQWSGQTVYSIDGIALIGRNPGTDNMYLVTGDCGNGITYGTIGAILITDLINGKANDWEPIYDPCRTVSKSAPGDYLHEVGNMIAQYGSWLTPGDQTTIEQLQPGHGAVIREGLKKITAYRDAHNRLHTCSAVCPHLGGILEWNADEQTFDCPLHGSRFTVEGKVINGPCNGDLEKV
jgi:glycine/D-amino acid oxidase-like deaminating enzyme/nitrite reductase/ring-hydroxylating ferredoxin subunit